MNKRKDIEYAWASMTPIDPEADEMLRTAWELGRIAGIKEAAKMALSDETEFEDELRAQAHKLERKLKQDETPQAPARQAP